MKSFVYCEWIDDDRLMKALPSAKFLRTVSLKDYKLSFVSFTEDGNSAVFKGGCFLEQATGESTPGLLYEFDDAAVAEAERLSRVSQGRYCAKNVWVSDNLGTEYEAVAYVIKHPITAASPSVEYKENMMNGARKHAFPLQYISYINTL